MGSSKMDVDQGNINKQATSEKPPEVNPFSDEYLLDLMKGDCPMSKLLDYIKELHQFHHSKMSEKDNLIKLLELNLESDKIAELNKQATDQNTAISELRTALIRVQDECNGQRSEISQYKSENYELKSKIDYQRSTELKLQKKTEELNQLKLNDEKFINQTIANQIKRVRFINYLKNIAVGICENLQMAFHPAKEADSDDKSEIYEKQTLYDLEQALDQIYQKTISRSI